MSGFISELSFLFHWAICEFLCQDHIVLETVANWDFGRDRSVPIDQFEENRYLHHSEFSFEHYIQMFNFSQQVLVVFSVQVLYFFC